MARTTGLLRLAAASALMLACCNDKPPPSGGAPEPSASAAPAPLAPADEAKSVAHVRCAMCHGEHGAGDGPSAATLAAKPRDWTNKEWQKSTSDADIRNVIVGGGAAIGKSPLMPPNPDLKDKPAVIEELVKIVRADGKGS